MFKFIFNLILILLVALFEISFLPFFYPLVNLDLALIIVIFTTLFFNYRIAFFWAILTGLIFDSFSLAPFPTVSCLFILILVGVKFFSSEIFNPKTFLGYLVIALISFLFFDLALVAVKYFFYFFESKVDFDSLAPLNFIWQIALNSVVFSLFLVLFKPTLFKIKLYFK